MPLFISAAVVHTHQPLKVVKTVINTSWQNSPVRLNAFVFFLPAAVTESILLAAVLRHEAAQSNTQTQRCVVSDLNQREKRGQWTFEPKNKSVVEAPHNYSALPFPQKRRVTARSH